MNIPKIESSEIKNLVVNLWLKRKLGVEQKTGKVFEIKLPPPTEEEI